MTGDSETETDADPAATGAEPEPAPDSTGQAVLARKYRPRHFDQLIGQDALVRTLTNAISSGRIHHAYLLTGVRGTGKTTTARIIAQALNYSGPDGSHGPTTGRTDDDSVCTAIAQGRHVDVLEMDAASHTGVANMRDILDSAHYRPVEARYKIYIIDEVHMLSKGAFNALLKTLEEPPAHLVFIFATTEVRQLPATVISRCLRFDLARVDPETLHSHYARICRAEGVAYEDAALAQIARAADGSVRDGLSLLDQAIAMAGGTITSQTARDMLGLAERERLLALAEAIFAGKPGEALELVAALYRDGGDPLVVVQDLMDLCHQLSRLKIAGTAAQQALGPVAAERGQALAARLGLSALNRAWQMLLTGVGEVQRAPVPVQALEMLVIRLAHTQDLPAPEEALRYLRGESDLSPPKTPDLPRPEGGDGGPAGSAEAVAAPAGAPAPPDGGGGQPQARLAPVADESAPPAEEPPPPEDAAAPELVPADSPVAPMPQSFAAMVELCRQDGMLYGYLTSSVHPVQYSPGHVEFRPGPAAPKDLAGRLRQHLQEVTGQRWAVVVSDAPGEPTLAEQRAAAERAKMDQARADANVQAVLTAFPGAELTDVKLPASDDAGGGT